MTKLHKALHLRHHKHTGKLLAHKHTSYRTLFMLMLAPILMLALVSDLQAHADDTITVSATVPANIPSGNPTIDSPLDGVTLSAANVTVSGTCPVITPAIIIAIYDNGTLTSSVQCQVDGTYSVSTPLIYGLNSLVATVKTVTNGTGGSSSPPVKVTRPTPPAPSPSPSSHPSSPKPPVSGDQITPSVIELLPTIVRVEPSEAFFVVTTKGSTTWQGKFEGGSAPYQVKMDWGDGSSDTHTVADASVQSFSHTYKSVSSYNITITATDSKGATTTLHSVSVSLQLSTGTQGAGDTHVTGVPPVVEFAQKYMWQIYIGSLSGLVFLWWLEHGRHLLTFRAAQNGGGAARKS
jgi:hypothetical protein